MENTLTYEEIEREREKKVKMNIMKNAVEMRTKTLCFTFDLLNHLCICLVYQSNLTFNHFFFEFLENIAM